MSKLEYPYITQCTWYDKEYTVLVRDKKESILLDYTDGWFIEGKYQAEIRKAGGKPDDYTTGWHVYNKSIELLDDECELGGE